VSYVLQKRLISMPYSQLMTEAQAAAYIGKSVKTLQRRRKTGQIAFIEDGGIGYRLEDLDAYLAARRVAATTPPPPSRKPKYRPASIGSEQNRNALFELI
jgi:hypothetical protein